MARKVLNKLQVNMQGSDCCLVTAPASQSTVGSEKQRKVKYLSSDLLWRSKERS
jgi:hypothetical protein